MRRNPARAALCGLLAAGWLLGAAPLAFAEEKLDWAFEEKLFAPVRKWAAEQKKEKSSRGASLRKVSYSRTPHRVDDSTYELGAHVNTAEKNRQVTERYLLTLKKESDRDDWKISRQEVIDTYVGLYRTTGAGCFPFESLSLDREGLKLSGSNGSVCATFLEGGIPWFGVHAEDLKHSYAPPPHAQLVPTAHDFYALHELMSRDHKDQLEYDAAAFWFNCDVETCERLLEESFRGLTLPSAEERGEFGYDASSMDEWARKTIENTIEAREKNPFSGFRVLDRTGNVRYRVFAPRELQEADGIWLRFDNWAGWEVVFGVTARRRDIPNQLRGSVYGYYAEDTVAKTDPYDLERRDSIQSRWFEVHSLVGEVELGTDIAEKLSGDVEFGLTLKQDVRELPFFIISFRDRRLGGGSGPKPIVVNSIEVDGKEATWVQTGSVSGRVILPEAMSAGSKIKLRMSWSSRAILKFTPSYSYLPRQGWMPFVRFGDLIDDFELTIRSPAKYDILGVGHKVDETVEDKIRISHWKADAPVNFPTVIFGRYESDTPKFDAKKLDGTVIPVRVHVDDASFSDWSIRANSLRPIAEQAANSINLYAAISGLDYPFGELNLVNDPLGFLYGQAPSSVIYLGSGVFRGEGALAPYFLDATGISKFLKSVVAHEVGHQWWGNRIANANDRNYWFVESLAEYFSALYMEFVYGPKAYDQQVAEWRRNILGSGLKGSVQNASTLFAGEWGGGREVSAYTAAVYNKGPYAFHMLRQTFRGAGPPGPEGADRRFFEFLKRFSQELAEMREIVTLDIQRAAERALGGVDAQGDPFDVDLEWFFDQWIRGSGVPEYALHYDVRQTEDGKWLIEGTIRQRVRLGNSDHVMQGRFYRGIVYVTAKGKGGPYRKRIVINGPETPLLLKIPVKPLEVAVNEDGEMLAHDTLYNQSW